MNELLNWLHASISVGYTPDLFLHYETGGVEPENLRTWDIYSDYG